LVERVVVIFYDKEHVPIEKFVFKLLVNQSYGSKLEEADLEFVLRAFLIKLTVAEPVTKSLPSGSLSIPSRYFRLPCFTISRLAVRANHVSKRDLKE
jgi:mitotic spindle assembly checkpoint protein MAD2B